MVGAAGCCRRCIVPWCWGCSGAVQHSSRPRSSPAPYATPHGAKPAASSAPCKPDLPFTRRLCKRTPSGRPSGTKAGAAPARLPAPGSRHEGREGIAMQRRIPKPWVAFLQRPALRGTPALRLTRLRLQPCDPAPSTCRAQLHPAWPHTHSPTFTAPHSQPHTRTLLGGSAPH